MCYIYVFLQLVAFVREHVVQGLLNGVHNEIWTHSCFQYKWLLVGQASLYRGRCSSFLECVYFGLLYQSLIFDMFIVVCVCMLALEWFWVLLTVLCECVCVCVYLGEFCSFKFTVSSFSFFLYMYTYASVCVCVCVCAFSFFLSSENMFGIRSN